MEAEIETRVLGILKENKGKKLLEAEIKSELETDYEKRLLRPILTRLSGQGRIQRDKKYDKKRYVAPWRYFI